MTNKEILQANLLDIVFENRNKGYGAYALRKEYNFRLLTALGAGISVVVLLIAINWMGNNEQSSNVTQIEKEVVTIKQVELPKDKPNEAITKPKEVVKQKQPDLPKVATVKFTTPPKITEDDKVKDKIAAISDMVDKKIDDKSGDGKKDDGIVKKPQLPIGEPGTGATVPAEPRQPDFVIQERDPEFPGGAEALKKFLGKNLSSPDELELGEKKLVQIRFKVDKDGTVTGFEILTSGGNDFDREVVRVCKKMPRWIPAIQNGINVPVSYVLPVTFIGLEE